MTVYERVRCLRKDILRLSQVEFSSKINVSRSNLGNIEIGRIGITERVINDICREFSVNKEWLLSEQEPIFVENTDATVNKILEGCKLLNETNLKYLKGYIDRLLEEQDNS